MDDPKHFGEQLRLLDWIDYKSHMASWRNLTRLNRRMPQPNNIFQFGKVIVANVSQTLHIGPTLRANRE